MIHPKKSRGARTRDLHRVAEAIPRTIKRLQPLSRSVLERQFPHPIEVDVSLHGADRVRLTWPDDSLTPLAFLEVYFTSKLGTPYTERRRCMAARPHMEMGWQECWVGVILLAYDAIRSDPPPAKNEPQSSYGLFGHQDEHLL